MKEAKARNPNVKIAALPWTFPGWVGEGQQSPYTNVTKTADYVVRWIAGAKAVHNLTTDYIGVWNERVHNVTYIKTLRAMLDSRGFQNVRIITADCATRYTSVTDDVFNDLELRNALYAMGFHYPGTVSLPEAKLTGLQLWASEDYR